MLGILLIDKPEGITSHDVVARVRRRLGLRRVGHAGTLDPIADGLLVVAVGPATRFLQYLSLEPKVYEADFIFGEATPTYDAESEGEKLPVPDDLEARIEGLLPKFRGSIQQIPPIYSAVKKDGKALYHYARAGEEVERPERQVFIESFEPMDSEAEGRDEHERSFRIVCSGGTYVRTLAHDLGQRIGCGAHMSGLTRTRVGRFHLTEAAGLEDDDLASRVIPLSEALPPLPILNLEPGEIADIRNGRAIESRRELPGRFVALADQEGRVFSVARIGGGHLQPECVLPPEALAQA